MTRRDKNILKCCREIDLLATTCFYMNLSAEETYRFIHMETQKIRRKIWRGKKKKMSKRILKNIVNAVVDADNEDKEFNSFLETILSKEDIQKLAEEINKEKDDGLLPLEKYIKKTASPIEWEAYLLGKKDGLKKEKQNDRKTKAMGK